MTRRQTTLALAAVIVVLVAAGVVGLVTRRADSVVALDGSARVPTVQGVLERLGDGRVVIDGKSRPVADRLLSFSTYNRARLEPRVGTYVQGGTNRAGRVTWLATIGVVTRTSPPRVRYVGRVRRLDGRTAVFTDGTVLRLGPGVTLTAGAVTTVLIDPTSDQIVTTA